MEVQKLREVLASMRLSAVAEGAGVSIYALHRIMRPNSQPRAEVVRKVTAYLEKHAKAVTGG